jgi:hypothetical protein
MRHKQLLHTSRLNAPEASELSAAPVSTQMKMLPSEPENGGFTQMIMLPKLALTCLLSNATTATHATATLSNYSTNWAGSNWSA